MWPYARILVPGLAAALVLLCASPPGHAGRGDLVRLQGDSDEAILIAQSIKDWLLTDLGSQRVLMNARTLIVQHRAREGGVGGLTDRERAWLRDPSRYDRLIVQHIRVETKGTGARATVDVLLTWDVALELWQPLSGDVAGLMGALAETMAAGYDRPVRVLVRFRDAEVLRVAADPGAPAGTIFSYR